MKQIQHVFQDPLVSWAQKLDSAISFSFSKEEPLKSQKTQACKTFICTCQSYRIIQER